MIWTGLVLLVVGGFGTALYLKGRFEVEEDFIGWDGKRVYTSGTHWSAFDVQMIDISERLTTFGVDELGVVSLVSTSRNESIDESVRGLLLPTSSDRAIRKQLSEAVATRQREDIRHRYVIVWKPKVEKIRNYLKQRSIDAALAEILRTIPEADLKKYEDILGITIVRTDGAKPRKGDGVTIADGVEIPDSVRDRHVYMLGRSGMGKSTLILSMALQDMDSGKGVAVLDPHGDLVTELLQRIPAHRVADVILFDAEKLPIGLNVFDASSDFERKRLADDVVTVFQRLVSAAEGPRMESVLRMAVRALAEVPNTTFLDIYRMFMNARFRDEIVSQLQTAELVEFWTRTYPGYPHPATEQPILTRMGQFAVSQTLATITGTISPLRISEVMEMGKILLCSIPKGTIGTDTSSILGTLLVSQFQLAAQHRAAMHASDRAPFALYIDEFQTFATENFVSIITEARKYQLWLTLANQTLGSLPPEIKGAVEGVETCVYFAPFPNDASHVAKAIGGRFTTEELLDLDKAEAVLKPGRTSKVIRVRLDPPRKPGRSLEGTIRENTRRNYPSTKPTRTGHHLEAVNDIPGTGDPLPE